MDDWDKEWFADFVKLSAKNCVVYGDREQNEIERAKRIKSGTKQSRQIFCESANFSYPEMSEL